VFVQSADLNRNINSVNHVVGRFARNVKPFYAEKVVHIVENLKINKMKVAITSTGNSLESNLDQRFGRCAFFVIYDTETKGMEYIPNPNKEAQEGAGPASAQMVALRNVKKIISGEFGIKIKSLLDSLKIQMIILKEPEKTIQDIINMLNH
jgi:predicted Fe-Mo cluster-binding NifX family protein